MLFFKIFEVLNLLSILGNFSVSFFLVFKAESLSFALNKILGKLKTETKMRQKKFLTSDVGKPHLVIFCTKEIFCSIFRGFCNKVLLKATMTSMKEKENFYDSFSS